MGAVLREEVLNKYFNPTNFRFLKIRHNIIQYDPYHVKKLRQKKVEIMKKNYMQQPVTKFHCKKEWKAEILFFSRF